jgi:hypothetical protein
VTPSLKTDRPAKAALWLAGILSLAAGLSLMCWFWPGGLPYDSTSGVWTALADDVAHGVLYRPVLGPLGYGGTRYMPLFFTLHGLLIRAGVPAVGAGLLLTLASLGLLGVGTRMLMRRFGAAHVIAWPCLLLVPASIAFQLLTVSVKGDLLAAAFSVCGLIAAVIWSGKPAPLGGWLAAAGFAAALLTKFTAGFALGAAVLWLIRQRRWAMAGALVAGTLGLVAVGLTLVYGLSAGHIVESFRVCATGGLNASYAWKFPGWFAAVAGQDPFFLAIFIAAGAAAARRFMRSGPDLPGIYFTVTAVGTVGLFASPGTDSNHLIDLLVASVVLLAVELTQGGLGRKVTWTAGVFALTVAATWLPGLPSVRHFFEARGRPTMAAVQEIQRRLPPGGSKRLLAENPLLPIALGQRPEVLDCFSLRLLAARVPEVGAEFMSNLTARRYSAVVLINWSGADLHDLPAALSSHTSTGVNQFYGEVHFPPGFLETLQANYRLSFTVPPFVVFEPLSATMNSGGPHLD